MDTLEQLSEQRVPVLAAGAITLSWVEPCCHSILGPVLQHNWTIWNYFYKHMLTGQLGVCRHKQ